MKTKNDISKQQMEILPADRRVKIKEIENSSKSLDIARELKKIMEHEFDGDTNCGWYTLEIPKALAEMELKEQVETN